MRIYLGTIGTNGDINCSFGVKNVFDLSNNEDCYNWITDFGKRARCKTSSRK